MDSKPGMQYQPDRVETATHPVLMTLYYMLIGIGVATFLIGFYEMEVGWQTDG